MDFFAGDHWKQAEFWRNLAPDLHVSDVPDVGGVHQFPLNDQMLGFVRGQMLHEGYIELAAGQWDLPLDKMAALIADLAARDVPVPFAYAYDEFWLLFVKLKNVIEAVLGPGYFRLPDFWAWHVDPQKDEAGWTPHRDKGYAALRPDGRPKSISVWIPLTDTNPLNGCMYLVPANRDPTYGTPQDNEWRFAFPDARALPARAGTIFAWNQAVLHWGSRTSRRERRPRISVSVEFQAGDVPPFNQPLMDPMTVPLLPQRLQLIGKQIVQYQHMYNLPPRILAIAQELQGRG